MVPIRPSSDPWVLYARELGLRVGKARAAHAAGITTFTYRKLEKGESNPGTPANPRLSTLVALAEVFDVSVASLLPEEKPGIAVGR